MKYIIAQNWVVFHPPIYPKQSGSLFSLRPLLKKGNFPNLPSCLLRNFHILTSDWLSFHTAFNPLEYLDLPSVWNLCLFTVHHKNLPEGTKILHTLEDPGIKRLGFCCTCPVWFQIKSETWHVPKKTWVFSDQAIPPLNITLAKPTATAFFWPLFHALRSDPNESWECWKLELSKAKATQLIRGFFWKSEDSRDSPGIIFAYQFSFVDLPHQGSLLAFVGDKGDLDLLDLGWGGQKFTNRLGCPITFETHSI